MLGVPQAEDQRLERSRAAGTSPGIIRKPASRYSIYYRINFRASIVFQDCSMASEAQPGLLPPDLSGAHSLIRELLQERARLIDFMSTASDMLWETDEQRRLIGGLVPQSGFAGGGLDRPTTERQLQFSGKSVPQFVDLELTTGLAEHEADVRARRPFRNFQAACRESDGSIVWLETSGNPIFDVEGHFRGYRGTSRDITKRKKDEEMIAFLASHDPLTGLPNRRLLGERLEAALTHASETSGAALICIDIDRFKLINDSMGHAAGDEALRIAARRIGNCVNKADTVARLGGDEFAVLLTGVESVEQVRVTADKMLEALASPCEINGLRVDLQATAGIAMAPEHSALPDALFRHADIALYRAKTEDSGRFRIFTSEMENQLKRRAMIEAGLRAAVENAEFTLVYQPLCNARSCRINGFEALVRWRHNGRIIGPNEFIPVAEETGLICAIGEWVLREACREAAEWPETTSVAVNLSPVQFRTGRLVESVRDALEESGLPGTRLQLEITEAVLMQDPEEAVTVLHKLRQLGVRISMDDFGTGHSSLTYLRLFPFDKIKIDRSFVRDATHAQGANAIIRAIAGLGSALGLETTAEGVETVEQLAVVQAEGCTEAQGYLFSQPVPPSAARELLARGPDIVHPVSDARADLMSRFGWSGFGDGSWAVWPDKEPVEAS